jgi:putative flippase GtrA
VIVQLARYLLVGVSNTAITLAVYAVVVRAGVPAVAGSVLGFGAGAVSGFRVNRAWTFRSARRGPGAAARYLVVLLIGLALNAVGVAIAVGAAQLPKLAAEVAALPPVTATTFLLARYWVFGSPAGTPARRAAVRPPRTR